MARRHWPWSVLGIDRTPDKAAIRTAYAVQLKAMDVDSDIDGFADLRAARDEALRDAAFAAANPQAVSGADDADDPDADFGPDEYEEDLDTFDDEDWDGILGGDGSDTFIAMPGEPHDGRYQGRMWGIPLPGPAAAGADENAPDRQLTRLLFPAGEHSDEAFTHEENEAALAALTSLLDDARAGDIGQEQAIDHQLAEMLAQGWPRSAPLVERASSAFGWLDQAGDVNERYALQFLNPRLRGMRFVTKVQLPSHPLHRYWEELKRPGKRTFADRFRINREGIETLLGGIRTRYPEVEAHLDAERVASWEKPAPSWVVWIVQRAVIGIFVVVLLNMCGRALGDGELPAADRDRIVAEAFGPGVTMAKVQAADPKLADRIYASIEFDQNAGDELPAIEAGVVERVRELSAIAKQTAPRAVLLDILPVRRDLLEAARGSGSAVCASYMETARLPDGVIVPESARAKERALAWALAQAKLLQAAEAPEGAKTLPLPPWVGPGLATRTGLTPDRINAVLRGEKTADYCAVRIALIDTLLSRPVEAPEALLRFM